MFKLPRLQFNASLTTPDGKPTFTFADWWNKVARAIEGLASSVVPSSRVVATGAGLTGGGDLSADRTIAMQFPTSAGTYTPTLSPITNITASSAFVAKWFRVGDMVTVSGVIGVTPTLAAATTICLSLPIASNLAVVTDLDGVAAWGEISQSGYLYADVANDRANLDFASSYSGVSRGLRYTFTYRVLP